MLTPFGLFGLGRFVNRYIATLPLIRRLCLRNYVIARPAPVQPISELSATTIIHCRNERGNVEPAVLLTPKLADRQELIFVEGGSSDGTWEEIQRVKALYP